MRPRNPRHLAGAETPRLWHNGGMSKRTYEVLGGLALVLVCVGVFAALWLNDPAHRPADTWRPGQHPELPTITPTPYPTLIGNAWLTNEPGQEMETDWNRAARACRAEDGEALYIVQTVTRRGIRYHLAEAYPGCKGWLPDYLIRR